MPQEEELKNNEQVTAPGFLVMYLPFNDDIREVPLDFPKVEANDEQISIAKSVMKKLKMRNYTADAFENPALQTHFKLIEQLALQKEEDDFGEFCDSTMPNFATMKERLDKDGLSEKFNNATEPSNEVVEMVNEMLATQAAQKRAASSSAYKGPKKMKVVSEIKSEDIEKMVQSKTVDKLKVDDLKSFLKSVGTIVTGKKKNELVQEVYDHFVM